MTEKLLLIFIVMLAATAAHWIKTQPKETMEITRVEVIHEIESHTGGEEATPDIPDKRLSFPVVQEDWRVTSQYGTRMSTRLEIYAKHNGVDIAPVEGSRLIPEVCAIAAGEILHHYYNDEIGGEYYVIDHGWGRSTYMHLSEGYLTERQPDWTTTKVVAGQPIGRMGATGQADGLHLHMKLELLIGGEYEIVNPLLYLEDVLLEELQTEIPKSIVLR